MDSLKSGLVPAAVHSGGILQILLHKLCCSSTRAFLYKYMSACMQEQKKHSFLSNTLLRRQLYCVTLNVKVKYLRGVFWWSRPLRWPDFPCPWSQALCYAAQLYTLSLHTLSMVQLLLTRRIIYLRHAQLYEYMHIFVCFAPSIMHSLTGAAYSHNMAFSSFYDRESNSLPPDERAGTLTT